MSMRNSPRNEQDPINLCYLFFFKFKLLKFISPDEATCTDPCTPNPCNESRACSNTFSSPLYYSCGCAHGYSGASCNISKEFI